MILEQLVTAGTTTQRCIKRLIEYQERLQRQTVEANGGAMESGVAFSPGMLSIRFYRPSAQALPEESEPQQSHLKLTIVDGEVTVLGSGNMDRASWYTSQELGLAFISTDFAAIMRSNVDEIMRGKTW